MNNFIEILNELSQYKRSRSELSFLYIKDRLDSSLSQYYKKLNQSVQFLQNKNKLQIINKLDNEVM